MAAATRRMGRPTASRARTPPATPRPARTSKCRPFPAGASGLFSSVVRRTVGSPRNMTRVEYRGSPDPCGPGVVLSREQFPGCPLSSVALVSQWRYAMEETRKEEQTPRFRIEALEERIAPAATGCATALEN